MWNFQVFLIFFFIIFYTSESLVIRCQLKNHYVVNNVSSCEVESFTKDSLEENEAVQSCTTTNEERESCHDARAFKALNLEIFRFPLNLHVFIPTLFYLTIDQCQLKEIHSEELQHFTQLLELSLKGNEIKTLEVNLFEFNANLTHIYLSENKISSIHPNVFEFLPKLKILSLRNNNCTSKDANEIFDGKSKKIVTNCNWISAKFGTESLIKCEERHKTRDELKRKGIQEKDKCENSKLEMLKKKDENKPADVNDIENMQDEIDRLKINLKTEEKTCNSNLRQKELELQKKEKQIEMLMEKVESLSPKNKYLKSDTTNTPKIRESSSDAQIITNIAMIIGVIQVLLICIIITAVVVYLKKCKRKNTKEIFANKSKDPHVDSGLHNVSELEFNYHQRRPFRELRPQLVDYSTTVDVYKVVGNNEGEVDYEEIRYSQLNQKR